MSPLLEPIYIQRQRRVCNVVVMSLPNGSQSDSPVTSQSLGVTVQHQNNRLDLGAMMQRHSQSLDVNGSLESPSTFTFVAMTTDTLLGQMDCTSILPVRMLVKKIKGVAHKNDNVHGNCKEE